MAISWFMIIINEALPAWRISKMIALDAFEKVVYRARHCLIKKH